MSRCAGKFEVNGACFAGHPDRGTDPSCSGLYDTLAGHRRWTIVGFSVAGALGVGAAVSFFLNANADSADKPGPAIGPGPAPLGLSYGGRF